MEWLWLVGYVLGYLVTVKVLYNMIYSTYVQDELTIMRGNLTELAKLELAIERANKKDAKLYAGVMSPIAGLAWPMLAAGFLIWKPFAYLYGAKSIQPKEVRRLEKLKADELAIKTLEEENKNYKKALKDLRSQGIKA